MRAALILGLMAAAGFPAAGFPAAGCPAAAGFPAEREPATSTAAAEALPLPAATPAPPMVLAVDRARLERAAATILSMRGVESLLVQQRGRLILERYGRGGTATSRDIKSASKSILSALAGIALEQGLLEGLDEPIGRALAPLAGAKAGITLRHLLTMTSGLEPTSGPRYGAWVSSANWVRYVLERPLLAPPGERFAYSTGNTHLLSAMLARASGASTLELARRALLDPLGVEVTRWERDPQGIHFGGNSMSMTARSMARFGELALSGGVWEGRQLVPREWMELSTRAHAEGWPDRYGAYGFLWWIPPAPEGAFMAVGYGGQVIFVSPVDRAVVVVTADQRGKGAAWDRRLLALIADEVLPSLGER